MQTIPLKATARAKDKKAAAIRKEGFVPCVVYGNEIKENLSIQCEYNEIRKVYTQAGESTIVDLDIGDKKIPVLFHDMEMESLHNKISHVDFYALNMKKEIETNIPLHIVGESLAVKDLSAILVTVKDHVAVRCLPADLPHQIEVSIESLKEFHDQITVADLKAPKGVTIDEEPETVLLTVQEPRKEEEPLPAATDTPAEGAEGAAAPAAEGGEGAAPAAEGDKK